MKPLSCAFAISISVWGLGCSSSAEPNAASGGSATSVSENGGSSSGGKTSGKTSAAKGGSKSSGGSSANDSSESGGAESSDGGSTTGQSSSSKSSGGGSSGGTKSSSSQARGGDSSKSSSKSSQSQPGGSTAAGGSSTSPTTAGGTTAKGGTTGTGGNTQTCALPTTYKWTSGGPIVSPKSGWVSIKDFTHVFHDNKHIVYMTTHDQSNWGSAMMTFADWPEAASAPQTQTSFGVAPTLFYFTPKQLWVLAYQWGSHKFSYRTSSDPTNPSGWSAEKSLYKTALPPDGTGPIDQTVICNSTKCYLYYAGDNGHIYKSSMPIDSFPGEFAAAVDSGIVGTAQNLFEAVQIYSVQGSNKYLMIVEAQGNGRYFRAWTATDLEGPWTLLTDSFAGKSNVTFSQTWTNDISHGDLVRSSADETFPIDPCNLQLVFQGRDPNSKVDYGLLPYKMGLLTFMK